jgi:hypothetical protein
MTCMLSLLSTDTGGAATTVGKDMPRRVRSYVIETISLILSVCYIVATMFCYNDGFQTKSSEITSVVFVIIAVIILIVMTLERDETTHCLKVWLCLTNNLLVAVVPWALSWANMNDFTRFKIQVGVQLPTTAILLYLCLVQACSIRRERQADARVEGERTVWAALTSPSIQPLIPAILVHVDRAQPPQQPIPPSAATALPSYL